MGVVDRLLPATVSAMCCIGFSAAISLATAAEATFLTATVPCGPLLAASLIVTVLGSALTFWRHRMPGPLVLTVAAAAWVYAFIYLVGGAHGGTGHGDHMTDHMSEYSAHLAHHAGFSGGRLAAV